MPAREPTRSRIESGFGSLWGMQVDPFALRPSSALFRRPARRAWTRAARPMRALSAVGRGRVSVLAERLIAACLQPAAEPYADAASPGKFLGGGGSSCGVLVGFGRVVALQYRSFILKFLYQIF